MQQIFNWSNMKMSKCKKLFTFLLAALALTACTNTNEKMSKCDNEKLEISFTTEQAVWMSAIACDEAKGDLVALKHSRSCMPIRVFRGV